MSGATVTPWPLWHPAAEHIRAADEPIWLILGPNGTGPAASVEATLSPGGRPSTSNPQVLRAFGDAFHRWADHLEQELARPPAGQSELPL
jgi:hypothetical protein